VATTLQKLHTIKEGTLQEFAIFDRLDTYLGAGLSSLVPLKYIKELEIELLPYLKSEHLVLCHNNLIPSHLLYKGEKVYLLSLDNASLNSKYYDLATFITNNELTPAEETSFLQAYFGSSYDDTLKQLVARFGEVANILGYLQALYFYKQDTNPLYLDMAKNKLAKIRKALGYL
jgi:thiamine kinase-like enzyme